MIVCISPCDSTTTLLQDARCILSDPSLETLEGATLEELSYRVVSESSHGWNVQAIPAALSSSLDSACSWFRRITADEAVASAVAASSCPILFLIKCTTCDSNPAHTTKALHIAVLASHQRERGLIQILLLKVSLQSNVYRMSTLGDGQSAKRRTCGGVCVVGE